MAESLPCIFGEYALIQKLGQGAAGDVFLSRPLDASKALPSPLVIKRLHDKHSADDEFVRRFRHEAEIAVRFDTPFIAQVYEVGQSGASLYIAMEYVPGLALNHFLSSLVNAGRYAPLPIVVQIVSDALAALDLLHSAEVVHRDVSPKNLMLGDDGILRLIDLGFAKSSVQDWKTQTGVVMGSLGYMPPEQIQAKTVDRRADLYSIGVVLFELLCVRRFIKPDSIAEMVRATMSNPRSPPSQYRRDVSEAIDRIVLRATARSPEERFANAREFHRALVEAVPERPTREQVIRYLEAAKDEKQRAKQAEIARLLEQPLPLMSPEDESAKTTVYVTRPSAGDTLALATALLVPNKTSRRSTIAMVAAALAIGMVVGSTMMRRPEPVPLAPEQRPEQPTEVVAEPRRVEVTAREEAPPPVIVEEPTKKKSRARTEPTKAPEQEPTPPPPAIDPDTTATRLEKRAKTILGALPTGDQRAAGVQKLLLNLTMTRTLKDPERRLEQILQLEKELETLAREHP